MLPSSDKQTSTKSHKKEEQRTFLILGLFWEKTSNKRHDVWYQCANDSPNRTVKWTRTDATFFLSNGKKLWVVLLYTPTLSRVFSATFSTWFSSLRSQSNSSQFFKTFFFPIIATHWLKYEKKLLWTLWKHTSIYMKLWFLKFTSCQPPCLIYLF